MNKMMWRSKSQIGVYKDSSPFAPSEVFIKAEEEATSVMDDNKKMMLQPLLPKEAKVSLAQAISLA